MLKKYSVLMLYYNIPGFVQQKKQIKPEKEKGGQKAAFPNSCL